MKTTFFAREVVEVALCVCKRAGESSVADDVLDGQGCGSDKGKAGGDTGLGAGEGMGAYYGGQFVTVPEWEVGL